MDQTTLRSAPGVHPPEQNLELRERGSGTTRCKEDGAPGGTGVEVSVSTVVFRRPARRTGPELPTGEISLQEPPALPEVTPGGGLRSAMTILPMMLMSGVMVMMF